MRPNMTQTRGGGVGASGVMWVNGQRNEFNEIIRLSPPLPPAHTVASPHTSHPHPLLLGHYQPGLGLGLGQHSPATGRAIERVALQSPLPPWRGLDRVIRPDWWSVP
eukprot:350297-Chlamydomonas_euryale.AAC.2